jgi:uncharacterized protein YcgI (DUF1989 family)
MPRDDIAANINWFMYVPVSANGEMAIAEGPSKSGDFVDLLAERYVICVACKLHADLQSRKWLQSHPGAHHNLRSLR